MSYFKELTSNIKGDLFGGITAGIVALPLAIAFGMDAFSKVELDSAAEIGARMGLYGAIFLAVIAALGGGTPTQISGPTAPMTAVSKNVIAAAFAAAMAAGAAGGMTDAEIAQKAFPVILLTFALAGVFQILFGVLRVGRLIRYIPYPVVSGFMSGIGVIIILGQIFPFFGADHSPKGGSWGILTHLGDLPEFINGYALALAALTVAIIYLFPLLTKAIPSSLMALVAVTLGAYFVLEPGQVNIIGDVPAEAPPLQLGAFAGIRFADLSHVVLPALMLAALGSIDSLLTSVVADNLTKTQHDSNRELVGQGLGNVGAALFGGIPGAGATMRTVVNINAGGRGRLSGVVAGVLLLVILLALGPFVGYIPKPVLSGILITVGIGIIDYRGLRHLNKVPRADAAVMLSVLLLTVFVDLLQAVGIGMVLASVLFMKRVAELSESQSTMETALDGEVWPDEESLPNEVREHIYIKHLFGPLTFGVVSSFQELSRGLVNAEYVVIRMDRCPLIDQSGLYALEEVVLRLEKQGVRVSLVGLQSQPESMLRRIHIIPDLIGEADIFADMASCRKALIEQIVKDSSIRPEEEN